MQRSYYLIALSVFAISAISWQLVHAGDYQKGKIDGDQLQEQAEEILKSETGARKVTLKIDVAPENMPDGNTFSLEGLDLDKDGILTRDEVGEKLFRVFDRDGNLGIDNIEMEAPSLIVFSPMEKKRTVVIDYFAEDKPKKKIVTTEEFIQESGLGRFDKDADGLSPSDFLQMSFNEVNVKDDIIIDLYEWKRAYVNSLRRPIHMENYNYNN